MVDDPDTGRCLMCSRSIVIVTTLIACVCGWPLLDYQTCDLLSVSISPLILACRCHIRSNSVHHQNYPELLACIVTIAWDIQGLNFAYALKLIHHGTHQIWRQRHHNVSVISSLSSSLCMSLYIWPWHLGKLYVRSSWRQGCKCAMPSYVAAAS